MCNVEREINLGYVDIQSTKHVQHSNLENKYENQFQELINDKFKFLIWL